MPNTFAPIIAGLLLAPLAWAAGGPHGGDSLDEDWLNSDPEFEHQSINDGRLTFLDAPPSKPVHHHHNSLVVEAQSLKSGWVRMRQCHDHLDKFPSVQILYHRERVRDLEIESARGIEQAWVEDNSVQLRRVREGARICVQARSKALTSTGQGTYVLRNGPFMRRFLDGYFPMQVSIDVRIPDKLKFKGMSPQPTDAVELSYDNDSVHYNAWFEGRLNTEIQFETVP